MFKFAFMSVSSPSKDQIIKAAGILFRKKGFKATTIREIAQKSKTNIALVSYYFGDKEKLYNEILSKDIQKFRLGLSSIIHDPKSSIREKLIAFVNYYFDQLEQQPELSAFVMNELQKSPGRTAGKIQKSTSFMDSVFYKQIKKEMRPAPNGKKDPMQVLVNLYALTVFPFSTSEMIKRMTGSDEESTSLMISNRRAQIVEWILAIHF
ncbi:MAG TPA: hypothetical protein DEP18_02655 [Flavobacteriales bacterium]|nr:hypothetical protein [Flavobacteriales bacterium]HCA82660.1 hypothetical protein [Flavobacteriales bacterium]